MKNPQLFTAKELRQPPLTPQEKRSLVDSLYKKAKAGVRYLYDVQETAGMLRLTIDEMQGLIYSYKIDCVKIRALLRLPWWSIAEYVIDPADDIDKAVDEWLKSLPHKEK